MSLVYREGCLGQRCTLHSHGPQMVTEAMRGRYDPSSLLGDVKPHAFPLQFWKISTHLSMLLKVFSTFLVCLIRIPAVLSHATYILLSQAVYWPLTFCVVLHLHHITHPASYVRALPLFVLLTNFVFFINSQSLNLHSLASFRWNVLSLYSKYCLSLSHFLQAVNF